MKKKTRFGSLLLALVMLISMLPAVTPQARAAESWELWIGDTQITDDNLDTEGWSYNPGTQTLIVGNPSIAGSHPIPGSSETAAIYARGLDLTVMGGIDSNGTADYGIYVSADASGAGGSLTLVSAVLNTQSGTEGVWADHSVNVYDSDFHSSTQRSGIHAGEGVTIINSNVHTDSSTSSVYGICAEAGDITVSGSSYVYAKGASGGLGIAVKGNIYIKGGKVESYGHMSGIKASGLYISGSGTEVGAYCPDGCGVDVNSLGISTGSTLTASSGIDEAIGCPMTGIDLSGYTDPYVLVNTKDEEDGAIEWNGTDPLGSDGSFKYVKIMPMPAKFPVTIRATNATYGGNLNGAELQILDKNGNEADHWVSDYSTDHTANLISGTYKIRELNAPSGFIMAGDVDFSVDESGKIATTASTDENVILVEHSLTSVSILAVDAEGDPLSGAELGIYDGGNILMDYWTTSEDVHTLLGLDTGAEYHIDESETPEGHQPAETQRFSIAADGKLAYTGSINDDGVLLVTHGTPVTTYPLWVGGVQADSKNKDDILSDGGSAKYNPETSTLTLNNADITGTYSFTVASSMLNYNIYAEDIDLTVNGSAKLTNLHDSDSINGYYGLRAANTAGKGGNLTLNANITADCTNTCITAAKDIDITGGKLDLTTGGNSNAVYAGNNVTISGGEVQVNKAGGAGIYGDSVTIDSGVIVNVTADIGIWARSASSTGITINGGEVTVTATDGDAIYSFIGVAISGGTVTVNATGTDSFGIYAGLSALKEGNITISGDDTVVTADGTKAAIYTDKGKIVINAPLGIVEPVDGKLDSAQQNILDSKDAVATHALIAKGEYYPLWVGGVRANSENRDDILGDGTGSAKYNPATKTLTLNNPVIKGAYDDDAIYAEDDLIITGTGTVGSSDLCMNGIMGRKSITITGNGTNITAIGSFDGIYAENKITVTEGVTLNAEGSAAALSARNEGFEITGATVTADGGNRGIVSGSGPVNISKSEVTATATNLEAIYGNKGCSISDSTVKATGGRHGMFAGTDSSISISGEQTKVTATGTMYGMYFNNGSEDKLIVSGGEVTAIGGTYAIKTPTARIDLSGYANPCVLVNTKDEENGAAEWNGTDPLGSDGSFKYVKIMPKPAYTEYALRIGGVQVTSLNKDDIFGDGTAKYEPESMTKGTLTLNNPTINAVNANKEILSSGGGIVYNPNATSIILSAINELTIKGSANLDFGGEEDGIISECNLIIDGDFTIKGSRGIAVPYGNLSLEGGTIAVEGVTGITVGGNITISGGKVTATGDKCGIYSGGSITIDGAEVTASSTSEEPLSSCAIRGNGDIKITDSKVTATGGDIGIRLLYGDLLEISGANTVVKANTSNAGGRYGISMELNDDSRLVIKDGCTVEVGGKTEYGCGIYARRLMVSGKDTVLTAKCIGEPYMGGLLIDYNVEITDATVTASGGKVGIIGNKVTISNAVVTASGTDNGIATFEGDLEISGEKTVVTADGDKHAMYANGGAIKISSPLTILEPNGGEVKTKDGVQTVCDGEDVATHALIAKGEYYPLWVGGVQANSYNKNDILGDETGSAKYNPATKTLTLNDPKITNTDTFAQAQICAKTDLTVLLDDDTVLDAAGSKRGIYVDGYLVLKGGENKLTVKAEQTGIYAYGMTVDNGTFDVSGDQNGFFCYGDLFIKGGSVKAQGLIGIFARMGNIEISGGTAEATGTGENGTGIKADKNITISGGEVTATSDGFGIYAQNDISISGENTVVTADGGKYAIYSENGTITISSPLAILEPNGGEVKTKDGVQTVCDCEDVATHALIAKGYVVTWQNDDGTVLQSYAVAAGETPVYKGAEPTKAPDAQYTYKFEGWTPAIVPVTGDATYTAVFDKTVNSYTITWVIDGVSETETYEYGKTPAHAEPTKAPDAQYTYKFEGWTPAIVPVTGDATYTAVFDKTVNSYTITWVIDGVSETETYEYGKTPAHADPTKAPDAQYTYKFHEWTPAIVPVTGDATYTAVFDKTVNSYTVTWVIDGVSETETYEYGKTPAHADPTKAPDAQYTYKFREWTPAIVPVTGDATYTAVFDKTVNSYNVTWVIDGVSETETYEYGKTPAHADPTKAPDAQYTYKFREWTPAIVPVTGDATYTAVFDKTVNSYNVTWVIDGVSETETYEYGKTPAHADPTKAPDAQYTYKFEGWTPAIVPVTGDATYTAVFDKTVNSYTITWVIDGVSETETYEYGKTPAHADPTKAPDVEYTYTFKLWTPDIVPVTEDAAYTAVFDKTVNVYTVTFVSNGGSLVPTQYVNGGAKAFRPLNPTLPGYVFYNWYIDPGLTTVFDFNSPIVGDTTLYARWTRPVGLDPTADPVKPVGTPGGTGIPVGPGTPVDPGTPGSALPFTDIDPNDNLYEIIKYLYENGIMKGVSEVEFDKYMPLNRAMIVTILYRAEGEPAVTYAGAYPDVPEGMWYTDAVEWATTKGIAIGYDNGNFGPNDPVTREQMAAFLYRYAQWKGYDIMTDELDASDADQISDYAVPAVKWAVCNDILWVSDTLVRPRANALRWEVAVAIYYFIKNVVK